MFVAVGVDVSVTGVSVAVGMLVVVTIGVLVGTMVGTGCPATVTFTTLDTPTCKLPCSNTA